MGVAYDLFGNGRTAVKAQLGRYISKLGTDLTEALNPIGTSVTSVTRSWNDYTLPAWAIREGVTTCPIATSGTSGSTASAAPSATTTSARTTRTRPCGIPTC